MVIVGSHLPVGAQDRERHLADRVGVPSRA